MNRPNILLITIDAQRADQIGCYGEKVTRTPAIDRLCESGIVFEQAFPSIPWTTPSMFSLFTSRFPKSYTYKTNVNKLMRRKGFETIAKIMKKNKYLTIGISGSPIMRKGTGYALGFDTFLDPGDEQMLPSGYTAASALVELENLADNESIISGEKNFFFWIHFMDPHGPYTPPDHFKIYENSSNKITKLADRWVLDHADWRKIAVEARDGDETLSDAQPRNYMSEVTYTDFCVDLVVTRLKELSLSENTIIILTADHGNSFGRHDNPFGYAYTLYQDVTRVPLIIVPPDHGNAGVRIKHAVSTLSIKPTIIELAGINPDQYVCEGESLVPYLKGIVPHNPPLVYSQTLILYDEKQRDNKLRRFKPGTKQRHMIVGESGKWVMVTDGRLKFIYIPTPDGPEFELYDLNKDPDEMTNIVNENPEKAKYFQKKTMKFLKEKKPIKSTMEIDAESEKRLKSLGYIE